MTMGYPSFTKRQLLGLHVGGVTVVCTVVWCFYAMLLCPMNEQRQSLVAEQKRLEMMLTSHPKVASSYQRFQEKISVDTSRLQRLLGRIGDRSQTDRVIQALNEGASDIVVSEVFLTISNHTAEGEHQIEAVNVEDYGASLTFTGPMWDSEGLRSMFVKRANAHIEDTDKSKIGVLLVGHGQPDEWDVEWATETEQETAFREEVLKLFAEDGYDAENMSLAWMSFKEPKPAEKAEEFYENGIEKLIFYSAAISADSIHSQYDIPELVYESEIPEDIPIINLGAWNDDPIVIEAIKEKIDQAMAATGS